MPAPKRRAPRRTAAAIAEDLIQARRTGGLHRAVDDDLASTMDWLSVASATPDDASLYRARDLLVHYTNRVCDEYKASAQVDRTVAVAAVTLKRLLLRRRDDTSLAEVIRREALEAARHSVSHDAVRHREDKLIAEIARQAGEDLDLSRSDVPHTVEAATHRLAPLAADVRQDLHDLLCVTYAHVPAGNPHEQRVIDSFYRGMVIQLGELLVASTQLVEIGLRSANLERYEFALVSVGRKFISFLFNEFDDRQYMLEFMRHNESRTLKEASDRLRSTTRGAELYSRWIAWAQCCFPTCAFERATEETYMCQPHAFLTSLYDFEVRYIKLGYCDLNIPGNQPVRHHRLTPWSYD